jgi:hypothetical protein
MLSTFNHPKYKAAEDWKKVRTKILQQGNLIFNERPFSLPQTRVL